MKFTTLAIVAALCALCGSCIYAFAGVDTDAFSADPDSFIR